MDVRNYQTRRGLNILGDTGLEHLSKTTEKGQIQNQAKQNAKQLEDISYDLQKLLDSWETLPEPIRKAVLALVESVGG